MSRVDAFVEAGNDLGQSRSVGGQRGNARQVWARLNTDNRAQSNCALHVRAEVYGERHRGGKPRKTCHQCGRRWVEGRYDGLKAGESYDGQKWVEGEEALVACPQCGTERQGADTRKTIFRVGLPSSSAGCEVRLEVGNPAMNDLFSVGVGLCAVKAVGQATRGEHEKAATLLKNIGSLLAEHEAEMAPTLGAVILPGGVSLSHALACVRIVGGIVEGSNSEARN